LILRSDEFLGRSNMTSRRLLFGVALFALSVDLVLSSGPVQAAGTIEKIAPRVLAETASGGTTEALVVLAEQADLSHASVLQSKLQKGRFVVNALRAVADRTQAPILAFLEQRGTHYQSFYIVNMIKVTGNRGLMQELAARSDVGRVDANPQVRSRLPVPTTTGSKHDDPPTVEWNIKQVHAPEVWALGFRGQGLVVAGADTGVQWDHPALKLHYRGWKGGKVNHNYNWHDATPDHSKSPIDPYGHGTFTVSETVGDDGHGNQVGVAPRAKWIACRNMDANGTGSPARYTECFEFLIAPYPIGGNPRQGKPELAPDSINNSWECPSSEGCSVETLRKVVNAVRAAGIFPAMAAENSGPNCSTVDNPPAIYSSAVSVGATDSSNNIADFSSRGPVTVDGSNRLKPNLSAPGVNVRGAFPTNQYGNADGTSMAAPHLAGGVALLWQAKPALVGNIAKTESILTHSSLPLRSTQNCGGSGQKIPNNVFGWGLLDLLKAVKAP
jgi:serine protease AprX